MSECERKARVDLQGRPTPSPTRIYGIGIVGSSDHPFQCFLEKIPFMPTPFVNMERTLFAVNEFVTAQVVFDVATAPENSLRQLVVLLTLNHQEEIANNILACSFDNPDDGGGGH